MKKKIIKSIAAAMVGYIMGYCAMMYVFNKRRKARCQIDESE